MSRTTNGYSAVWNNMIWGRVFFKEHIKAYHNEVIIAEYSFFSSTLR